MPTMDTQGKSGTVKPLQTSLTSTEVAVVLATSVARYVALGVDEVVAIRLVALDNEVTGNCIRAAMKMAQREVAP